MNNIFILTEIAAVCLKCSLVFVVSFFLVWGVIGSKRLAKFEIRLTLAICRFLSAHVSRLLRYLESEEVEDLRASFEGERRLS